MQLNLNMFQKYINEKRKMMVNQKAQLHKDSML